MYGSTVNIRSCFVKNYVNLPVGISLISLTENLLRFVFVNLEPSKKELMQDAGKCG